MKKYELKYTKGDEGVFRMSTVENPAVKCQLVMFDDELKAMMFEDDEKQVIYSVAMRPNMLIPRKNINGEPAMVFYSEETVRDLQQNFFRKNSHNGGTVNHNGEVNNDMYCFESWIVEDPEKDKATALGLDVKKGDWVLGQKIEDPAVWGKVKNKELTGFSIEAYLEPEEVTDKNDINMNMSEEEFDKRVKEAAKKVLMESTLGKEYIEGDKKYFIDKLEAGGLVTDGEGLPMPNATFTVEKTAIKTDENGKITEAVVEVEQEGEDVAAMTKEIEDLKTENADLKAKITELEGAKVEMSAELAATKKVAMEMATEGLKPKGDAPAKKYEEMSNAEKAKYNRGKY